jgi:flagellar biosynthesis/type III secretory pathway protein FliH
MSDQPPQPPYLEIPDQAANNPYRIDRQIGERGESRAKGFDGDLLDSLLKSRMIEGIRMGHADGLQQAGTRYADIYDEGYRRGAGEGFEKARQATAGPLLNGFEKAQAHLMQIAAKAKKGGFTHQAAESALDALRSAVQAIR